MMDIDLLGGYDITVEFKRTAGYADRVAETADDFVSACEQG
jgi:hypothetical protein